MKLILKPDWDPSNPYHYHVNGQKVVITPEDWEKYKDNPTFREVRAAVEAEQAAHPEPEYDEVENPAWRQAYQNLVNGVNLKGRSNYLQPLPQGYTRDSKGVPMDAQGNYYLPVETATDAPYFVNQERGMMGHTVPVRYEQQQMPERTIRQLKQPLPVDKQLSVSYKINYPFVYGILDYLNYHKNYLNENGVYTTEDFFNNPDKVVSGFLGYPIKTDNKGLKSTFVLSQSQYDDLNNRILKNYTHSAPEYEYELSASPRESRITKQITGQRQLSLEKLQKQLKRFSRPLFVPTDLDKVGTFAEGGKLISKYQIGGPYKRDSHTGVIYLPYISKIKPYDDFKTSVLLNKPILSLSGKSMEMDNKLLTELDDYLKSRNVGLPLRLAILYNVVQEGSTTKSHRNGAYGLLGWRGVRIPGKGINQMEYLYNTIFGKYNVNHWKDGSSLQAFINAETVEDALNALTHGYVRPGLELREFRSKTKYFNKDEETD